MLIINTVKEQGVGMTGCLHRHWSQSRIILGELVQQTQKNQCYARAGTLGASSHLDTLPVPLPGEG